MDKRTNVSGSVYNIGPQPQPPGAASVASSLHMASLDAKIAACDTNAMRPADDARFVIGNTAFDPVNVRGLVDADLANVGGKPYKLGPATAAWSQPVTLATDQPPIAVIPPALQCVAAADGAIAALGSTQETPAVGDKPGTVSAKLRGINATLETLNDSLRELIALNRAILEQQNAIAGQLGAHPVTIH